MSLIDEDDYYKNRLKSLFKLFINYWTILIIFSIVGIIANKSDFMPGGIIKFLLNALALENSYNGAWWYMFTYAVLVLISPFVLKEIKKRAPIIILLSGFAIYCLSYAIRFWLPYSNWILSKIGPFGTTLFEYIIGAEFYHLKVFSKTYPLWEKISKPVRIVGSVMILVGLLYFRTKVVPSLFAAPFSGICVITLFHYWKKPEFVCKAFTFVGSHSTNIWLTHMFFYSVLFKNLVYVAKFPLPIFVLMIGITIAVSMLLKWIEKPIMKIIT